MLVSVILTCYNGERWIGETLQSVCGQTYPDWELIAVNDGSADGSQAILERFEDRRIRRIQQANCGIPGARNRGLKEARGEAICVLDQDDLWDPNKLALQVRHLAEQPEVGVVYTNADHIDAVGRLIGRRFEEPQPEGWLLEHFLRRGIAVPIVTTMIRRLCFDKVGGFNERLFGCDDYELLVRLAAKFQFGYLPMRLAKLRYHPQNAWLDERMFPDRFVLAEEMAVEFPQHLGLIRRYRASAHYAYGLYLLDQRRPGRARREFGCAIRARPGYWKAYLRWLETRLRTWKPDLAR